MKKTAGNEQEAIETAAAEWLARRDRRFTAEEAVAFARWRMADPRHAASVAELEGVWSALDQLSLANGQQRAGGAAAAPPAPVSRGPWWRPALTMAAVLALVAGALVWFRSQPVLETTLRYETQVGSQRKVGLADGSELHLNTDSAVNVRFSERLRRVELERGEAFFQVARDPARPFVVAADRAEARALGTAFSVRRHAQESEVLVTEGRVAVGAAELKAGQRAILALSGAGAPRVETPGTQEIGRRLAWQSGRLEFKRTPLREAVAEFNRYHRQRLVVRDEATGAVSIGGPFEVDNLEGFMRLLDTSFDVVVVSRDADHIVLGLRP